MHWPSAVLLKSASEEPVFAPMDCVPQCEEYEVKYACEK